MRGELCAPSTGAAELGQVAQAPTDEALKAVLLKIITKLLTRLGVLV